MGGKQEATLRLGEWAGAVLGNRLWPLTVNGVFGKTTTVCDR